PRRRRPEPRGCRRGRSRSARPRPGARPCCPPTILAAPWHPRGDEGARARVRTFEKSLIHDSFSGSLLPAAAVALLPVCGVVAASPAPAPVLPRPGPRLGIAAVDPLDAPFVARHVGYPGAIDDEPNRRPVRIVRRRGKPDGLPVGI